MINKIFDYFLSDPLKILYLIGGGGGVSYWVGKWRDRIRIRVYLLNETYRLMEAPNLEVSAEYEIENVGGDVTSIMRRVMVSGYTPKGEHVCSSFDINTQDRILEPFSPKGFELVFKMGGSYPFLLFRTYTFSITRGRGKKLRVWSASKRNIGFFRFYYELMNFKIFGRYNEPR